MRIGARIWETAFEAWPEPLLEFLGPMDLVPLCDDDLIAMGWNTPGFPTALGRAEDDALPQVTSALAAALDAALPRADGGAVFPRLGITSFKADGRPAPLNDATGVIRTITRPNPRLAPFLAAHLNEKVPATLYLRPFLPLLPWGEFRVFVLGRAVMGVSQYPATRAHPEIRRREAEIRQALVALFAGVLPLLHLDDVVLDVALTEGAGGLQAHLIELNPAIRRTDPGLFDWRRPEGFDRGLRYLS